MLKSGSGCEGGGAHSANPFLPLRFSQTSAACPLPSHHSPPSRHLSTGDGRRALSFFHQKGLQDFDALLLSDDGDTLYVGTREAILALNIEDPGVPRLKNMVRARERVWAGSEEGADSCPVPGLPMSE